MCVAVHQTGQNSQAAEIDDGGIFRCANLDSSRSPDFSNAISLDQYTRILGIMTRPYVQQSSGFHEQRARRAGVGPGLGPRLRRKEAENDDGEERESLHKA